MGIWILVIFIGVPLMEIMLFIKIGGFIGLWSTMTIVIITAIIGTTLIRRQGLQTLNRAQQEIESQRLPVQELFEGICLIISGALLLTPGFLTDVCGFMLLVPPLRKILGHHIWKTVQNSANTRFVMSSKRDNYKNNNSGPIIDAEAKNISEEDENGNKVG
jgi:UPF0716 protein FxsA